MARTARFDRQTALDSAVELFWTRGYYASSMKQIEGALDMRPGSLYATFGNKSGLFAEALQAYAERSGNNFQQIIGGSQSPIEGLKSYLRSFARPCSSGSDTPSKACMLVKTLLELNDEDAELRQQVEAMLDTVEQGLCAILEKGKDAGELRADVDCARLARLLQTQIIGLRAFASRDVPQKQVEALAEDMVGLLDSYRAD